MVNAERMRYYKTNTVTEEWNEKLEELCSRLQIRTPVLLMESALLKVPVLIGCVKPVILIPVGMLLQLSGAQVEAILLHELAHVRRHDYLVNLIQNAIDTLFFFNPAVLWISALIRSERENCCDDIAIGQTRSRKQFVEALVSFNQYSNTISNTCSLSWVTGKSQLLHRVQRIVTKKNNSLRSGELLLLLAVLLLTGSAFITLRHTCKILAQTPAEKSAATTAHKTITAVKKVQPATAVSPVAKPKLVKNPAKTMVTAPAVKPVEEVADAEPVEKIETEQSDNNDDNDNKDLGHLQTQLKSLGYLENDLGRLKTFRDHGLSAGYIESILAAGYSNVSIDLLLRLHDHGLRAAFLTGLKKQGYSTVSLEEATELVDHGVSIAFIESFRQLGFKNISLEEATTLRDHGVSSSFIEQFKKKTGTLLSLDDYVKLKDSGINPLKA